MRTKTFVGTVACLALAAMSVGASADQAAVRLDGAKHQRVAIKGDLSGISGALPYEPVTVPGLTEPKCVAPSCEAVNLTLTLPSAGRRGQLTVNAGTSGANLGVKLRLIDRMGKTIATSGDDSGVGLAGSGVQQGQVIVVRQLAPGNYVLYVMTVAGSATYSGTISWRKST